MLPSEIVSEGVGPIVEIAAPENLLGAASAAAPKLSRVGVLGNILELGELGYQQQLEGPEMDPGGTNAEQGVDAEAPIAVGLLCALNLFERRGPRKASPEPQPGVPGAERS